MDGFACNEKKQYSYSFKSGNVGDRGWRKGGSLDAGLKSIDYGKRLFVPQYAEFPTSALGNALLIQHGAYPLRMKRSSKKQTWTCCMLLLEVYTCRIFI